MPLTVRCLEYKQRISGIPMDIMRVMILGPANQPNFAKSQTAKRQLTARALQNR
jgi:hypothetical protein